MSKRPSSDLWPRMRSLLERVWSAVDRDAFLDELLDELVELFGADRGMIMLTAPDGGSQTVNARGRGRALDALEREEVSKTIIRQAQQSGQAVSWAPHVQSQWAESMTALGITAAIAAPMRRIGWSGGDAGGCRGVVYLDFRNLESEVGPAQSEFLDAAAAIIAIVFGQSEQLASAREDLRRVRTQEGDATLQLDDVLRLDGLTDLRDEVASIVDSEGPVLIEGASGTGKTVLAMALAAASGRTPVVRGTLGSSDDLNTITSELFGHEQGAFSGATASRTGLVEFADGGTLILDEILNLPLHAQQLLLDFTQFGTYRPLGHVGPDPKRADVRLIAVTNGDLDDAIAQGRFRGDLFYRLAGARLQLPLLRDRCADILYLAGACLRRIDPARGWSFAVATRRLLLSDRIQWPGNVRQLEAVIRRARERALAADPAGATIRPEHFRALDLGVDSLTVPPPTSSDSPHAACAAFEIEDSELADSLNRLQAERSALDDVERRIITAAIARNDRVVAHAARELGLPRTSLVSRMQVLGIDR